MNLSLVISSQMRFDLQKFGGLRHFSDCRSVPIATNFSCSAELQVRPVAMDAESASAAGAEDGAAPERWPVQAAEFSRTLMWPGLKRQDLGFLPLVNGFSRALPNMPRWRTRWPFVTLMSCFAVQAIRLSAYPVSKTSMTSKAEHVRSEQGHPFGQFNFFTKN